MGFTTISIKDTCSGAVTSVFILWGIRKPFWAAMPNKATVHAAVSNDRSLPIAVFGHKDKTYAQKEL